MYAVVVSPNPIACQSIAPDASACAASLDALTAHRVGRRPATLVVVARARAVVAVAVVLARVARADVARIVACVVAGIVVAVVARDCGARAASRADDRATRDARAAERARHRGRGSIATRRVQPRTRARDGRRRVNAGTLDDRRARRIESTAARATHDDDDDDDDARAMKIDEVPSLAKKSRVAAHPHIKVRASARERASARDDDDDARRRNPIDRWNDDATNDDAGRARGTDD